MDTEKFKMGWLVVAFDLPVGTKKQRKAATGFRNFLIDDGYQMMQFSVYARACVSFARQETHIDRLKKNLPPEGSVRAIFVTRAQWERSYVIQGSPATEAEAGGNARTNPTLVALQERQNQGLTTTEFAPPVFGIKAKLRAFRQVRTAFSLPPPFLESRQSCWAGSYRSPSSLPPPFLESRQSCKACEACRVSQFAPPVFGIKAKQNGGQFGGLDNFNFIPFPFHRPPN